MKKKIAIFSIFFLILDLISKLLIDNFFSLGKCHTIINNFFYITKIYNEGISFSLLSGKRLLIIIFSITILIFILKYIKTFKDNKRNILAFSFIIGGLLGNLIDRIIYGYVIDFIDIFIFDYNFPIFNLADIFICIGIFLLIIAIIKGEDNENSSK